MTDLQAARPASPGASGAGPASGGAGSRRMRRAGAYAGLLPFLLYVTVFLLLPTLLVAVGAFQDDQGAPSLSNVAAVVTEQAFIDAFVRSIQLSVVTALAGAVLGGLLAWAVASGSAEGQLRHVVVAASGVLAQFGGVMLAFAFLATFGINGLVTLVASDWLGLDPQSGSIWVYGMTGLAVVYTYFQLPLMLIVFLPAIEGLRQEWYDGSASLGGNSWSFWRHVGGPILAPSFLGAVLLLFANAFSAYATAAALISQGSPIVTLQIRSALTSEVILGQANVGKALALGMIVIVSIVMALYALVQRRASRWVR
ncbi:MAG: ABC transporter permease subunit [Chloroflexota bacterium]